MAENSEGARQARWNIAPYFLVDDVVTAANFYREKLGFKYERFWGEPACFCMVYRAGITIMLSQQKGLMRPNSVALAGAGNDEGAWDAYVWVEDSKSLYKEFKAKGVNIARDLCEQEYRNLDFDVLDCNGYRLCFGSSIG